MSTALTGRHANKKERCRITALFDGGGRGQIFVFAKRNADVQSARILRSERSARTLDSEPQNLQGEVFALLLCFSRRLNTVALQAKTKIAMGSHPHPPHQKRTARVYRSFVFGGGRGIRTPVGLLPNGFQVFIPVSQSVPIRLDFNTKIPDFQEKTARRPKIARNLRENCEEIPQITKSKCFLPPAERKFYDDKRTTTREKKRTRTPAPQMPGDPNASVGCQMDALWQEPYLRIDPPGRPPCLCLSRRVHHRKRGSDRLSA